MDVCSPLNLCSTTPKSTKELGKKVKDGTGKKGVTVTVTAAVTMNYDRRTAGGQVKNCDRKSLGNRQNLHRFFHGRTVASSPFVPVYRPLPEKQTSLGRYFLGHKARSTPFVRSQCRKPLRQTTISTWCK